MANVQFRCKQQGPVVNCKMSSSVYPGLLLAYPGLLVTKLWSFIQKGAWILQKAPVDSSADSSNSINQWDMLLSWQIVGLFNLMKWGMSRLRMAAETELYCNHWWKTDSLSASTAASAAQRCISNVT